jgi:hypothetical protein
MKNAVWRGCTTKSAFSHHFSVFSLQLHRFS